MTNGDDPLKARQDAWQKTHQATSALFAAGWSEAAVGTAVRLYREAIALDPELALAYAHKALIMAFAHDWGLLHGNTARDEARADAEDPAPHPVGVFTALTGLDDEHERAAEGPVAVADREAAGVEASSQRAARDGSLAVLADLERLDG